MSDGMFWTLYEEIERLRAQIAAVRALHTGREVHGYGGMRVRCFACDNDYPCPTIRYLDGDA